MNKKLNQKIAFLEKAVLKLEIMINEKPDANRAQIDSSIQRFKFCFELFWKTLQLILDTLGEKKVYPKEVLQAAFRGGLIENGKVWLNMLNDRNETSHVYDEVAADRVYNSIKNSYFITLKTTLAVLKSKFYQ